MGQTGPVWDVQTVRITFASEVVPATRTQLQVVEPQVEVGFYKWGSEDSVSVVYIHTLGD